MSNGGRQPGSPRRVYRQQQASRLPSHYSQPYTPAVDPGAAPAPVQQQFTQMHDSANGRPMDLPSATFSRANRDRGLSNVFASHLGNLLRRPASHAPSRLPQSSAGYQDFPDAVSQEMSLSEGPTDVIPQVRMAAGLGSFSTERAAGIFPASRAPIPASRNASQHSQRFHGGSMSQHVGMSSGMLTPEASLNMKFRKLVDGLTAEGIIFPTRPSQLSTDHAIQAFTHFYSLFLPLPPDFPTLDFTRAEGHQAARVRAGVEAVEGLLKDLCYEECRQTIAEMANLSRIEYPHRTVSALYWLMDIALQARLAVPRGENEEISSIEHSLEYAEYAARMMFASSRTNAPGLTVPEARQYIDSALERFRSDKEDAIARHKVAIAAIEQQQSETTRTLEAEAKALTEVESRRSQLENQKRDLQAKLTLTHSTLISLKGDSDYKNDELSRSRADFETMRSRLAASGIDSPQKALQLSAALQAQQIDLEKLEAELKHANSDLLIGKREPAAQQLKEILVLAQSYSEDVDADATFPSIPTEIDDFLGKSASEFLSAKLALFKREKWEERTQTDEIKVIELRRHIEEVDGKVQDLESNMLVLHEETQALTVELEQLERASIDTQRETQLLKDQLHAREKRLHESQQPLDIVEKKRQLQNAAEKLLSMEGRNRELELEVHQCASRKREIRVLLETYKASYARIIEAIGWRENAIQQQEKAVSVLQQVLKDYTPPSGSAP